MVARIQSRQTPFVANRARRNRLGFLGTAAIFLGGLSQGPALAEGFTVIDGDATAREERPHGEVGLTTVRRFTDALPKANVVLRTRTFQPGSEYGVHTVSHDQAYYVLGGQGELIADGVSVQLKPGMVAYVFKGSVVQLKQSGAAPFAVMMTWSPVPAGSGPLAPGAKRPPIVVQDREIAREERPHGGVGMSTGYRYSDHVPDRAVHFRRRTLRPGAEVSEHAIPWDMGYYVLEGAGTITVDGVKKDVRPGVAVYTYANSLVRVAPEAGSSLSYLLVEPAPPAPPLERQAVRVYQGNLGDREVPPHNGKGDSTSYKFTNLGPGLEVELRKRVLMPGAQIGEHHLGQDQIFYVEQGEVDIVTPSRTYGLKAGMAAYGARGTPTVVRQKGAGPATVLSAWSVLPQP